MECSPTWKIRPRETIGGGAAAERLRQQRAARRFAGLGVQGDQLAALRRDEDAVAGEDRMRIERLAHREPPQQAAGGGFQTQQFVAGRIDRQQVAARLGMEGHRAAGPTARWPDSPETPPEHLARGGVQPVCRAFGGDADDLALRVFDRGREAPLDQRRGGRDGRRRFVLHRRLRFDDGLHRGLLCLRNLRQHGLQFRVVKRVGIFLQEDAALLVCRGGVLPLDRLLHRRNRPGQFLVAVDLPQRQVRSVASISVSLAVGCIVCGTKSCTIVLMSFDLSTSSAEDLAIAVSASFLPISGSISANSLCASLKASSDLMRVTTSWATFATSGQSPPCMTCRICARPRRTRAALASAWLGYSFRNPS